ncbi:MAG: hypothetical protein A2122_02765 [Candidatus Liptonbacteria bacterium GWB1_49_6]|uniref:Nudix hydrolase domain-containing protein n=1 Tax=Candidatus Liptonbacteria bacterium GWB1_49_6 TaxID=1798644 RepID=A0A1G2C8X1_9BACT|nr:MAG: hypothetical protein A2122_02765 [Candidatus Liptonbacteria bacterium GWB1_49_6]
MVFYRSEDFFKKEPRLACGASVYLQNLKGDFLLQLRTVDVLREPNKWTVISGKLESPENPEYTVLREAREELGIELLGVRYFRDYQWNSKELGSVWYNHNFVFYALIDVPVEKINLTEGQKIEYFPIKDILNMDLAFNHNEVFRDLLKWHGSLPI